MCQLCMLLSRLFYLFMPVDVQQVCINNVSLIHAVWNHDHWVAQLNILASLFMCTWLLVGSVDFGNFRQWLRLLLMSWKPNLKVKTALNYEKGDVLTI